MNLRNGIKASLVPVFAAALLAGCNGTDSKAVSPYDSPAVAASIPGDHYIFKWNGSSWDQTANGGGHIISADAGGVPWVINSSGDIWKKNDGTLNSSFTQKSGKATDIDIGADGSVWILGNTLIPGTNDYPIYKWNGSSWSQATSGGGVKIAVDPNGVPWVMNNSGDIWKKNDNTLGSAFTQKPGKAVDIDIGADGSVWKLGNTVIPGTSDFAVYKWNGSSWDQTSSGGGVTITVAPNGVPWIINSAGNIWKKNDSGLTSSFTQQSGTGSDIDIGANGSVWLLGVSAI